MYCSSSFLQISEFRLFIIIQQSSEAEPKNFTQIEIETLLKRQGKSLRDYESMPFPENDGCGYINSRLILDELNYDRNI
ncbi:hypothetical protein CASFOL_029451 [Castilleja foliolosa]|uniref:Uncharacterized protein n=1 Tax=Castilleja foliolosa TaxID=1961234 RepID=A0ABD3CA87_9LAMI